MSNKLLIVDDDKAVSTFIGEVAEKVGFEVKTVNDPTQAKTTYDDFHPSLIILDLVMPDVDGVQLIRLLGEDHCTARLILLSGADTAVLNSTKRIAEEHGLEISKIFGKPIDCHELERQLRPFFKAGLSLTKAHIESAIEAGQIVPYFQPKIKIAAGSDWRVEGFEVLARWPHPEFGMIPPASFIPQAEATGLIHNLTEVLLSQALAVVGELDDIAADTEIAVNLSPIVLKDSAAPDLFAQELARHRISAERLILEVTEGAAMENPTLAMESLTRFRLKGIKLSIDDFGTGYSSLVQLHRMPFTELKIDRSFMVESDFDENARTIVRSIVDLGHNLGLRVCAEGIETRESLEFLRSIGCDQGQGYFICKPLPEEELAQFLEIAHRMDNASV